MPLSAPPRKRRAVSVTSLIDVIFLLLLFFMLTSTFTKFAEVSLVAGGATEGAGPVSDAPPLFLRLAEEEITVNGIAVALQDLEPRLAELAEAETTSLIISIASDTVTSQRLVDILVSLASAKGLTVTVLG